MSAESRPSRAARLRGIHSDLTSGSERTFHRGIRSAAAVLRVAAKILLVAGLVDVLLLTVVIDGSAGLALVLALVLLLPAAFLTWHSRDPRGVNASPGAEALVEVAARPATQRSTVSIRIPAA